MNSRILQNSILVLICSCLFSCTPVEILLHADLSGYVIDAATSNPLVDAKVKLNPLIDSTNTDINGKYMFQNLSPEIYEIEASKYYYGTISKTASILQGRTQEINFALNAVPVPDFSRKYLDFGLDSTTLSFTISNKGVGEMSYVIVANQDWITLHPSMGKITDESDRIVVTIDKTGLSDSIHKEIIKIISITKDEVVQNTIDILLNGIMDQDLNYYSTVRIGTQVWMAENISTGSNFSNLNNQTDNGITEKYCYGNNKGYCNSFGGLYLWDEMMQYNPPDNRIISETRGICPTGWHIPSYNEWNTLINYLGGTSVAGGKLKAITNPTEFLQWRSPNTGATDEAGFHAYNGNFMIHGINYNNTDDIAAFWTASDCSTPGKWCRYFVKLSYNNSEAQLLKVPEDYNKDYAYSVRCVKNP